MSCTSPLWFVQINSLSRKGKVYPYLDKPSPGYDSVTGEYFEPIKIPCGQCRSCRIAKSREWANRCVMENTLYPDGYNWFITLTYNDENLPQGDVMRSTLCPDDVTKFLHDLRQFYERKYNHVGIRYFYAGEYGDKSKRPHYHMLLYNCPIIDLKHYKYSPTGDEYFTNPDFDKLWNKGFVVIGELNWNSAAYTARYTLKKLNGEVGKDYYTSEGVLPEFCRMSRRPGIGLGFFEKFKDKIYTDDTIVLPAPSRDKSLIVKPPKYFDRKMLESESDLETILLTKEQRKQVADICEDYDKHILGYNDVERFHFLDEIVTKTFVSLDRNVGE